MSDSPTAASGIRHLRAGMSSAVPAHRARSRAIRTGIVLLTCGTLLIPCTAGCTGLTSLASPSWFSGSLPGLKRDKKTTAKKDDNQFGDRIETPLLSEYISVQGNSHVVLRGVGLVTGLDGTGDDPPPSTYRTQLQNEMSRRNIRNPGHILASRDTALVLVTALLPPMVRKDQRFDVRVVLPPNSKATSLRGGWLLETRLFEEQVIEGRGALKGHEYAVAGGAILLALGADDDRTEKRSLLMRGTIPGGAVSKTERDLSVVLRTERRGFRNSQRVANTIAGRFYHYNKFGERKALAEAKTDALIELKVHPTYRNNFPRYQRVIRSMAFHESEVARRLRMEQLAEDLLQPATTHQAALQLEAIGDDGIPFLKRALAVDNFEVQFEAAESLAYLGDGSGVEVLRKAAADEPAFRVYALAALSVIDEASAVMALRELMNHPSLETRYGAFTSLRELDPRDPSIPSVSFDGGFTVYTVESDGEPMVHVKRYRAPEVVLFGVNQILRLPAVLNAGRNIRVIGHAGSHEVTIHRYQINEEPATKVVSNRLFDVIRAVGEMGATYPDIVQLLIEAEQQHNLSGDFGIDRLPQSGRTYERPEEELGNADIGGERRIGSAALVPNLFDRLEEDAADEAEVSPESDQPPTTDAESPGDAATSTEDVTAEIPSTGHALSAEPPVTRNASGFSLSEPIASASDPGPADDSPATEEAAVPDERLSDGTAVRPGPMSRIKNLFRRSDSGDR